jgi:DNA-directed RNA polymerase subunit RPC12/RpoP
MRTHKFFACPNCGNARLFKVFTSSFQVVMQSPDDGTCIGESGILPNLRQNDNYVECQLCHEKSEYDIAVDHGKKYLKTTRNLKAINVPVQ